MARLSFPPPLEFPKYNPFTVKLVEIVVLSGNPIVVVVFDVETSISFVVQFTVSIPFEGIVWEIHVEPSEVSTLPEVPGLTHVGVEVP